jgi:hypothetical protein
MTLSEFKENVRPCAKRGFALCLTALVCLLTSCSTPSPTAGVRMNQIQVIGTHNSYHQRMHDSLMELVKRTHPDAMQGLDYGHRPLTQQLSDLNIRQIELDCYVDPDGGRFAHPIGPKKAAELGLPPVPSNDPEGELLKPGIKVMHIPDIDFGTSVLTLVDGLKEVREWSVAHPRHVPVFILIELKDEILGPEFTQALPWDATALAELERTILSVFPRREILMPDDVRGSEATLPEALHKHGWPMLDSVRGKVMFGMDNEGAERETYLQGHPALEGRVLFVSETPDNPAAAWMKRNDPIKDFDEIQTLVREGFLVRTRADEPTGQARNNDTRMRDHALASGAQFVSTDYPEPNLKLSPYHVQFPDGGPVRSNPVIGPPDISGQDLEPR